MADVEKHHNSLWEYSASPQVETPALAGDLDTDVLIIGGGYTGLSTALHLGESGVRSIVLEAQEVGHGGSGRNAGLVNPGVWLLPNEVEEQLGKQAGGRLNAALSNSPDLVFSIIDKYEIDCEAKRNGMLQAAHARSKVQWVKDRHSQMASLGLPVELITGSDLQVMTGSKVYRHAAVFDPRAGTIQPMSYARGLARAALGAGATIHQNCPVQSLTLTGNRWTAQTARGSVRAEQVIVATNAYTDHFLPQIRNATVPVFMFQAATGPLSDNIAGSISPRRNGLFDTRKTMISSRIDDAGRYIVCSAGRMTGDGRSLRTNWATRVRDRLFPQLQGQEWKFWWSGQMGFTDNHLPRVFQPAPGLTVPIGYNGRGIGPGTVIGKTCADLVQGGSIKDFPLPLKQVRVESWRNVRAAYYELGTRLYNMVDSRV
ncbi:FAD-binding oxidoreductase [uncultured Ruegeria sp.]|uniref:NAD(P)/FAD-dependent oxidoreductase n=1 Tax=uncultured Ruegeria sp. TaxID=259304 RepID=UPI0026392477|nr:FAD-binding oxidoreductase [uncultured Ruegeria sp.]